MGGVILGLAGPWAEDYCEDWPIPRESIPSNLFECGACGSKLCLVAQVYAPILSVTLKIEERIIYIFCCIMPKCKENLLSWHDVRVQKSYKDEESASYKQVTPSTLSFGSISNCNKWWEADLWTCSSRENDAGEDKDYIDLEELGRALSESTSLASHFKKQNNGGISESARKCSPVRQEVGVVHADMPSMVCTSKE
ncbi:hypothetical protein NE237_026680 [Protea cynaroides]|uniref:Programmed cell death protein 2 C-terminal domain-containing protein n=1 Tax=Protea cynaroides TaxID=273540 RepID=A0A9Q0K0R1_9MAGN|nr:hypothetical protein NE237_026680 [Protea cynaroides]